MKIKAEELAYDLGHASIAGLPSSKSYTKNDRTVDDWRSTVLAGLLSGTARPMFTMQMRRVCLLTSHQSCSPGLTWAS